MSYLLPAGMPSRTKNKWGLGVLYTRVPRSRGMQGVVYTRMPRSRGMQGLGRWKLYNSSAYLGQDSPDCPGSVIDPITGELCSNLPPIAAPPSQPGVNPAVQAAYQNLLTQQQNSQSPLDYVSPQAAIAAGLPAQTVYNAWSTAMAKFPTQQAALNAGIPAGVVTQLWPQSRAATPVSSGTTFMGIPITTLAFGAGAIFLLPVLLGGRGRR